MLLFNLLTLLASAWGLWIMVNRLESSSQESYRFSSAAEDIQ